VTSIPARTKPASTVNFNASPKSSRAIFALPHRFNVNSKSSHATAVID
jgi:hypothetical protein